MNEENLSALEEEILKGLVGLDNLQIGSKEYDTAIDGVTKLYKTELDHYRIERDYEERIERLELEKKKMELDEENRKQEKRENRIWSIVKYSLEGIAIVVPTIAYNMWVNKGLRFEKEGSITTTTFKGILSKFRPWK